MTPDASERDSRLDALRGLLLLIMAAVHVPTPLSHMLQEPFGYTSAAEGFVFLSAYLSGSVYGRLHRRKDWATMAGRVWKRARLIYGVHLACLVPMALLAWAVSDRVPSLANQFHGFLSHPFESLVLIPLLLQRPPLFDILPLYVVFLGVTPWLLLWASRRGWRSLLMVSGLGWLAAQGHFHGTPVSGGWLPIQLGSFNILAWQFLWVCGLGLGERSTRGPVLSGAWAAWLGAAAGAIAVVGLLSRHGLWPGAWFSPDVYLWMDKWTLGPLRLLNFAAWAVVFMAWRPKPPGPLLAPTALLGRHSLAVFAVHLLLTVPAVCMVRELGLSPAGQTGVGLAVMALLFPWAAWQERRKPEPARKPLLTSPSAVGAGILRAV